MSRRKSGLNIKRGLTPREPAAEQGGFLREMWATGQYQRQPLCSKQQGYCFPRYAKDGYCNGNSASAALGKWMRHYCEAGATVHGIRHAFRDRLRAVKAPVDLVDQLGGWSAKTVGIRYGDGYELQSAHNCLAQLAMQS